MAVLRNMHIRYEVAVTWPWREEKKWPWLIREHNVPCRLSLAWGTARMEEEGGGGLEVDLGASGLLASSVMLNAGNSNLQHKQHLFLLVLLSLFLLRQLLSFFPSFFLSKSYPYSYFYFFPYPSFCFMLLALFCCFHFFTINSNPLSLLLSYT